MRLAIFCFEHLVAFRFGSEAAFSASVFSASGDQMPDFEAQWREEGMCYFLQHRPFLGWKPLETPDLWKTGDYCDVPGCNSDSKRLHLMNKSSLIALSRRFQDLIY